MRFAVRLAYNGSAYSGWQNQLNAKTIQEEIETALFTKYREKISVVGCGRTDKGVHASDFVLHFDFDEDLTENFTFSLNRMLPQDISLYEIREVQEDFHARFDALSRSYIYKIHTIKNPFKTGLSFHYPLIKKANFDKLLEASKVLLNYDSFFPFCKTNTDVKTMICNLEICNWNIDKTTEDYFFIIKSNRFLRGMVRLIVGMTINVGLGKMSIEELKYAMDHQIRIKTDWSVPAHGLYLNEVNYPSQI